MPEVNRDKLLPEDKPSLPLLRPFRSRICVRIRLPYPGDCGRGGQLTETFPSMSSPMFQKPHRNGRKLASFESDLIATHTCRR
ncbi:FAD-binding protein [Anopheles sinensis]|uniref:FAD-binding protein n=1 Tax=Anopheles sinensis TaxID=74873 RepID=A0A084VCK5_ANOSI|nr:FAD-binding protein [Anopheles sinensis]